MSRKAEKERIKEFIELTQMLKITDTNSSALALCYAHVIEGKNVPETLSDKVDHLENMLRRDDVFIQKEKGARWIGFIQGQLEFMGVFTIDELRGHVIMSKRIRDKKASVEELKIIMEEEWKSPKI